MLGLHDINHDGIRDLKDDLVALPDLVEFLHGVTDLEGL
jgi:hypothetical protein